MARRLPQTLADYLVIGVSPALIMLLVGSLCFFLLEVFYGGSHVARLNFIMAMFVMGATLISRISMEEGIEYATLFGIPLGVLTGLAILKYVEIRGPSAQMSGLINLGLLGLLWWCASKLVWDCTLIDDEQDASGEGLLQVAGLDRKDHGDADAKQTSTATGTEDEEAVTSRDPKTVGFWERMIEQRRRPHAPGVWVIYFSLAALPLFGIGQWFIPASDLGRRQYAFGLLCIYVASGLALLVTTSFLGLRRYLRQRRLEMPSAMAATWMAVGCILIGCVVVFAAILPRPSAEYAISELPFEFGSPDQKSSSRIGQGGDGPRDDEQGTQPGPKDEDAKAQSNEGDAKDGKAGEKSTAGDSQQKNESSEAKPSEQSKQSDDPSNGSEGERKKNESAQPSESSKDRPAEKGRFSKEQDSKQQDSTAKQDADQKSPQSQQRSVFRPRLPTTLTGWLGTALKWIVYGVLLIAGVYFALKKLPALWAALLDFWRGLFGGSRQQAEQEAAEEQKRQAALRPFASYTDPFAAGIAGRYSAEELIKYTFEAFEAWAREHGVGRGPEQTPHEFAAQVGERYPPLVRDVRKLADLYSRLAYARGSVPASSIEQLRPVWASLRPQVLQTRAV